MKFFIKKITRVLQIHDMYFEINVLYWLVLNLGTSCVCLTKLTLEKLIIAELVSSCLPC